MRALSLAILVSLLLAVPAVGQGNESAGTASQAESPDASCEVQIGAGSTAAVTTGSSGPSSDQNPTLPGSAAPFSITPPGDGFGRPGMLPIAAPGQARCDLIRDDNARRRCERFTRRPTGGVSD
jgi:hypothetical protein